MANGLWRSGALVVLTLGLSFAPQARASEELERAFERAVRLHDEIERTRGGWIETPNGRMHYLHWPNGAGTPLVWAHGTWGSAFDLAPYAETLVAAGYAVVAIEYYGHGKTPLPTKEVSIGHVADDIAHLMTALGMERAVVGGHSRGGTAAAGFYATYPHRVLGLVLSDGGSFSWQQVYDRVSDEELRKRFATLFAFTRGPFASRRDAFLDFAKDRAQGEEPLASWSLRVMGRITEREGAWHINFGITPWLREGTPAEVMEVVRRSTLTTLFQASTFQAVPREIFRNLSVPMLILDPVSQKDSFPATDQNDALKRAHPDLVVHRIYADTGHGAGFERPARFMQDMTEFLARVREHAGRRPGRPALR
jgi:pimeloyl-ACP methyl ester carboxylesterase